MAKNMKVVLNLVLMLSFVFIVAFSADTIVEPTTTVVKGENGAITITYSKLPISSNNILLQLQTLIPNHDLSCRRKGYRCDGIFNQCCDPYLCTPPLVGICM